VQHLQWLQQQADDAASRRSMAGGRRKWALLEMNATASQVPWSWEGPRISEGLHLYGLVACNLLLYTALYATQLQEKASKLLD